MFNPDNARNEIDFLSRSSSTSQSWNSIQLTIPPTVYPPRKDTDLLHQVLSEINPFGSRSLLEIGSGSGALSIAAARLGWNVDACDINPYAVLATRQNAKEANVQVNVFEGGIGPSEFEGEEAVWKSERYDVVLWNMPYIPAEEVDNLLGPMEEAALIDTHPQGLLTVFARMMAESRFCKLNGIALLVCRKNVHWRRSVDVLRQQGLAARVVRSLTFDDGETIQVIATWHPFVQSKHHRVREVDSTNAELLRGNYSPGDSIVANIQTNGRGRHGNQWQDHPGSFKGSWMLDPSSIVEISPKRQTEVAQEIRFAICTEQQHLKSMGIKWPNDILVRCDEKQLWKKCGGILFQSYSKGDEQRIVFGIGINMTAESLRPGQGGLEEIHVTSSISSLFTTLNAVVASLFEEKTAIQLPPPEHEIRLESLLKNVFYRNNEYVLESVSDQGIGIVDSSGIRHVIETHDELSWTNLEPQ
jgi:release factor glutamine methyltransferase